MGNSTEQWRSSVGGWYSVRHCPCLGGNKFHVLVHSSDFGKDSSVPELNYFTLAVLALLLVIAGVEMNPGPISHEVEIEELEKKLRLEMEEKLALFKQELEEELQKKMQLELHQKQLQEELELQRKLHDEREFHTKMQEAQELERRLQEELELQRRVQDEQGLLKKGQELQRKPEEEQDLQSNLQGEQELQKMQDTQRKTKIERKLPIKLQEKQKLQINLQEEQKLERKMQENQKLDVKLKGEDEIKLQEERGLEKKLKEQELQRKIQENKELQRILHEQQELQRKQQQEQLFQIRLQEDLKFKKKINMQEDLQRRLQEELELHRKVHEEQKFVQKVQQEQDIERKLQEEQKSERKLQEEQEVQRKLQGEQKVQREFQQEQELQVKLQEEQEFLRKLQEEQELQRKLQEEQELQRKLQEEQDLQRKLQEEQEFLRKLQEKEELQRKLQEEQELQRKLQEEQELQGKLQEEQEFLRKLQEAEELQRKLQEEQELQRKLQEEQELQRKLQEEQEFLRKLQEKEELQRKLQEEQELQRKLQEEQELQRKLQEEQELQRKLQEEREFLRKLQEEEELQIKLQEEQELQRKLQEEQELQRKLQEEQEFLRKLQEEEELQRKLQEEQELQRKLQEEQELQRKLQEEQEFLRKLQEEQELQKKLQEEQELQRKLQEEQELQRKLQEEQELQRKLQEEQEFLRKLQEEQELQRKLQEEQELQRKLQEEQELQRKLQEEQEFLRKLQEEEELQIKLQEEQELQRKLQEEQELQRKLQEEQEFLRKLQEEQELQKGLKDKLELPRKQVEEFTYHKHEDLLRRLGDGEKLQEEEQLQGKFKDEKEMQRTLHERQELQRKVNETRELQRRLQEKWELQKKLHEEQDLLRKIQKKQELQNTLQEKEELLRKLQEEVEFQRRMLKEQELQRKLQNGQEYQKKLEDKQELQRTQQEGPELQRKVQEELELQGMLKENQELQQGLEEEQELQRGLKEGRELHTTLQQRTTAVATESLKVSGNDMRSDDNDLRHQFCQEISSHADTEEQNLETKVAALLCLRGIKSKQSFFLACNVNGVGKFGDLMFGYRDREQLLSKVLLLHLNFEQKVAATKRNTSRDLMSIKGDFDMALYNQSYPQIKNWLSNCDICGTVGSAELILFTNKALQTNTECRGDSMLLTGGQVYCFTEDNDRDLFSLFHELEQYSLLLQDPDTDSLSHRITCMEGRVHNVDIKRKLQELKSDPKKLSKELKDWGDVSYYQEFLEKFRLYSNQLDEKGLDRFLQWEIEEIFGTNGSDTVKIFEGLLRQMYRWWENDSSYLTDDAQFWVEMLKSHIDSLTEANLKKFRSLSIRYDEEHVSQLKKLVLDNSVIHVVPENCSVLSIVKVCQSLGRNNNLVVDVSTLGSRLNEVLALWSRWFDFLVVVGSNFANVNALTFILNRYQKKRLIFIAENVSWKTLGCKYVKFHDHVVFEQLDDMSQEQVLSSTVCFQGYDVPLGKIVGTDQNLIPADTIAKLLTEKLVLGDPLTKDLDYYIPRTLNLFYRVKDSILCHISTDSPTILAVSGLSEIELQELKAHFRECHPLKEQLKRKNKCKIVLIDGEEEFLKLADLCDTVHWLHRDVNVFTLKKSRGDMSVLGKYLSQDTFQYENVDCVLTVPDRVVLLSAEPGMGKSTLLTHLALGTKEIDPAIWIIRVNLNDSIPQLDKLPEELQLQHVLDFLVEVSGVSNEWKHLFGFKLITMDSTCVLIDGYDEIGPSYSDKVSAMLKCLQASRLPKLWITARSAMKTTLEQTLSKLAFTFKPFSEMDQRNFLFKFWNTSMPDIEESVLNEFISDTFHFNISDQNTAFVASPLHCMLLAEIFEEHLKTFVETGETRLPQQIHLLELYSKFVDREFNVYYEKGNIDETRLGISYDYQERREVFMQNNMFSAVTVLLVEDEVAMTVIRIMKSDLTSISASSSEFLDPMDVEAAHRSFLNDTMESWKDSGTFYQIIDNKPVFIHRTFADYFAALWFANNFASVKDYIKDKLFQPSFEIVRSFFDRMLAHKYALHLAVLNKDKVLVQTLLSEERVDINARDDGGRTALHLAVVNCETFNCDDIEDVTVFINENPMYQIIKTLLQNGADCNIEDEVFNWKPLRIADQIEAWPAVALLLEGRANSCDLVLSKEKVRRSVGNLNTDDDHYVPYHKRYDALHFLLLAVVLDCGRFLAFILNCGLDLKNSDLVSALFTAVLKGSLNSISVLIKSEANLEAQDDENKRTPLMLATQKGHLKVVQFLIQQGASVGARDVSGNTALHIAAEEGSFEVFKFLSQYSTDFTVLNDAGYNVLHCAAVCGNLELTTYILDKLVQDVEQCSAAMSDDTAFKLDVLESLKRYVNSYNNEFQTPLWLAAHSGHLQVVKFLCERDADLDAMDVKFAHTPVQAAATNGHMRVVDFLIEKGARVLDV